MAYDGNGLFVRLFNWVTDKTNGVPITASRMDGEDNGFAAGLSLCVTRDGQGKMTADFLPSVDNTLNLGSGAFRWAGLNGDSVLSGTSILTLTGCTTSPTGTASWARVGKIGTLFVPAINATSNTTAMTLTGLPAAMQPASVTAIVSLPAVQNNSSAVNNVDCILAPGSGTISFRLAGGAAGFTGSNLKGTGAGFAVTYPLI
jgi:hypothetical protein